MNAKHTPGPWGYEDPMGPDILTIIANPGAPAYEWIWIAQIGTESVVNDDGKVCDNRSFEEHEANARLIAASPEMFEALKDLVSALHGRDQCSVTRAAIAAAVAIIEKVEK